MDDCRPAAAVLGGSLLAWVGWEAWRLVWLDQVMIGRAGGPLLTLEGHTAGEALSWVGLPLVFGGLLSALTLLSTRVDRGARGLLGLGIVALLGWTALTAALGLGTELDPILQWRWLAVVHPPASEWSPWGRWAFDAMLWINVALLLGFGPRGPRSERALLAAMLVLLGDLTFRVGVVIGCGGLPLVANGVGGSGILAILVWMLLAGVCLGVPALLASLPGPHGPSREALLGWLALGGFMLGLQAATLYSLGLVRLFGIDTFVDLPIPLYDALLAGLRVLEVVVLLGVVALGGWRAPPSLTAVA